jgi:hypothetical protein
MANDILEKARAMLKELDQESNFRRADCCGNCIHITAGMMTEPWDVCQKRLAMVTEDYVCDEFVMDSFNEVRYTHGN